MRDGSWFFAEQSGRAERRVKGLKFINIAQIMQSLWR